MSAAHDLPGCFSWFGYPLPIDERMRLVADAGFRRVSIWLGAEEQRVAEGRPGDLCIAAERSGLTVECAHAPYAGCNLVWHDDEAAAAPVVEELRSWIRFCGAHGIPIVVAHASRGHEAPPPTERGIDRLAGLVEEATRCSVVLALENVRENTPLDFALERIESSRLGFCYDSSHDFLHAGSPTAILRRWGHRLAYTHLSDTDGSGDRHWLPGRGTVDWDAVAEAMPAARPLPLSLEVVPVDPAVEPVGTFLRSAHEAAAALSAAFAGTGAG